MMITQRYHRDHSYGPVNCILAALLLVSVVYSVLTLRSEFEPFDYSFLESGEFNGQTVDRSPVGR